MHFAFCLKIIASVSFFHLKLKDSKHWPHLEDSVYVIFESLEIISKEVVCVEFIIRGLLEHFFSKHRPHYHRVDIDWLLKLANEGVKWKQKPIRVFTDDVEHGIPLGVVKHYLLMVMTHEENPERKNITFADFNKEVRNAVAVIQCLTFFTTIHEYATKAFFGMT